MVVKIVGSTPTARTINESEVVGVLDTEQNKQIYETGRGVQTLRFAKEQGAWISKRFYELIST